MRYLIVLGFLFGAALVGAPNPARLVAAQTVTPQPTLTSNPDIVAVQAQLEEMRRSQQQTLEEMRRSQEQALDNITVITGIGAGIGVLLIMGLVGLIGVKLWQSDRDYDNEKAALRKYVTDGMQSTLASTRAQLTNDYSASLDQALGSIRPSLEKNINARFDTRQQQSAETLNRWYQENQALVRQVGEMAWRAQANDARILMQLAGLPPPYLGEYELRPPLNQALVAILDLIDLGAHPEHSDRLFRGFYFLKSYLGYESVTINQNERYQIEERLKRHRGHIHGHADEIERLVKERYVQQDMT